jgi:hypothetical protein
MRKPSGMNHIRLSLLLQSSARAFQPLDCHQIVAKVGAKQAQNEQITKNWNCRYLPAGKGIS